MNKHRFGEFLASGDTLRVYQESRLVFASDKGRLLPLLEYIDRFAPGHQGVIIWDKVTGNAAALLSIKADCREVYSPLGSQLAAETFDKYGIKYRLTRIVPYIRQPHRDEICPMEKLSLGKEPDEFYNALKSVINSS
jgi:hypothetical protein